MSGCSVNTLQKWGRKGILPAHRSPTNRRYQQRGWPTAPVHGCMGAWQPYLPHRGQWPL